MSVRIQYAYLKQQTWLYRRNYPSELQSVIGQALKQSLKTGDARLAKARAAEVNAKYEEIVTKARAGVVMAKPEPVRVAVPVFAPVIVIGRVTVSELAKQYLNRRSNELSSGGFKSVKFSVGLFISAYGSKPIGAITREDTLAFTRRLAELGKDVGRSFSNRGASLDRLIALSGPQKNGAATQKRTFNQVSHFMDWAVYEGQLAANPFKTVRVETKVQKYHYEALTDDEVTLLLAACKPRYADHMAFCLLSGMRAGEAAGLVRDDLIWKENLGWFVWIRPNDVRSLKTEAAHRFIPLHSHLAERLKRLPSEGRLFPNLRVNVVTKRFSDLRAEVGIDRKGVVFHSTRKWFVTQCERAGIPEHFTAAIVGHQSARSENRMTYGIYSAGISDEQKREIVEKVALPWPR